MATSDTTSTTAGSGSNGDTAAKTTAGNGGAKGTRRKLSDQQEREVTRLYAQTETPVSEISKRFGIGESSVYRVAQRHGAALRGRTATATTSRPAAKATAAKAATGTRGTRGGRGRAAAKTTTAKTPAKTAAKSTAKSAAKSTGSRTPSTNGRRTGARAARAAATPARRTGGRGGAAGATRTTRAPRGTAGRVSFRVSYVGIRTFVAANMADAIRQAEAAGATDITGIERRA